MKSVIIIFVAGFIIACKKDSHIPKTTSSINVINAAIDLASIKVNTKAGKISYSKITDALNFATNKFYYAEIGSQNLAVVSATDTSNMFFNKQLNFDPGIYSLYILGQAPNAETILQKEINFPFVKTDTTIPKSSDNVVNIRFVNLSPNSPPLKINIKNSGLSEVENFTYKSIGDWKPYVNNATGTTTYTFEIRNSQNGALIFTYIFSATTTNRFKNVALIIKGLVGTSSGLNSFGIFPANYF